MDDKNAKDGLTEAASEKRKGRPDVYSERGLDILKAYNKESFHELGERSIANLFYVQQGQKIAISLYGEDEAERILTNERGKMKYQTILEQIGRAREQDNFSVEDCEFLLSEAIRLLKQGDRVKDIEKSIRFIRRAERAKHEND